MIRPEDYIKHFPLELPIKDGEWWNGKPGKYSNLPYNLDFTQRFGQNRLDYSQFGLKGHNGLDFAGKDRTPIVAPIRMWVSYVQVEGDNVSKGYGNHLYAETETITENGDSFKLELVFGHFEEIVAKAGKWVEKGSLLGYMGTTGFSTGTHLHFGVRPHISTDKNTWRQFEEGNGYAGYIDPEPFLLTKPIWDLRDVKEYNMDKFKEKNDRKLVFNSSTGEIAWCYQDHLQVAKGVRLAELLASYLINKEGVTVSNEEWQKLPIKKF